MKKEPIFQGKRLIAMINPRGKTPDQIADEAMAAFDAYKAEQSATSPDTDLLKGQTKLPDPGDKQGGPR